MRITAIETIRVPVQPNIVFVVLHGEDGLTGLGESFFGAQAVESYIHETAAPILLETRSHTPESVQYALRSYLGYQGAGAETRGIAAIDVALWDLLAKQAGMPLARLLGGPMTDSIRAYNTCAGPSYVRQESRQWSSNWGLDRLDSDATYEDLDAFLHRPAQLARDLLADGYDAMKIWPFDTAAERSCGTDISGPELVHGLGIVAAIRDEVGDAMDVMIELHGLWQAPAAVKLVRALEQFNPYWIEDPVRPDSPGGIRQVAEATSSWIASGETVTGKRHFKDLLEQGAIDVATLDIMWCGGLTEARKIASLADAAGIPIAPHDCTGPISLAVCSHLVMSQPNGLIQETARAFINTWYQELVTGVPEVRAGRLHVSNAVGHGIALKDDVRDLDGVVRRVTEARR